jgi:hypothetical protein
MTEPTSQPKHTHYVSLENGCLHPALTSPAGYEDEHTTEWRPATRAEIERYQNIGTDKFEAYQPVPLQADAQRTEQATPATLTLADDDNLGVDITPPAPPLSISQPSVVPTAPPPPPAVSPAAAGPKE